MKIQGKMRKTWCALAFAAGMATMPAHAADVTMRVLGWYGNQPQSEKVERPFWKNLESDTQGTFKVNFRTIDEIGLKGFEALRTLQSGAFDIVSLQVSFVGAEAPVLMGVDLPGATFDFASLHKAVDAYRPIMDKELETRFNGKLMAAWSYPFQILYCKDPITGLSDLKGKKVRVSGALSAELAKQLGAAGVTLAGPEVYQGLMQGVVDCAITGSQYGNSNDWFEVSKTLHTAPIGGAGVVLHVARKAFWDKLTLEQQALLSAKMQGLEADLWKTGEQNHDNGINCNVGRQPCDGKLGKMTLVEASDADKELVKGYLNSAVIPLWLKDCSAASASCSDDWYRTFGAAAGIAK